MPRIEVIMPQMGESIAEGTIVRWHKKVGDAVRKDETLLEISTDKVDSEIPSPATGVLVEILVPENKTVAVRTVIAYLESDAAVAAVSSAGVAESHAPDVAPPVVLPAPVPQSAPASGRFYSPLVLSIARSEGIAVEELEGIVGSGEAGRLTKKDLLAYVQARRKNGDEGTSPPSSPAIASLRAKYPLPDYEIIPMSTIQQKMAHHMVESVRTSPHVAAIQEVDMTAVVRDRDRNAAQFEQREGFKLTFMPYIAEAVVAALKKHPLLNSTVEGNAIVRKRFIHLGIAVASENGLLVPVLKHAEEKSFLGFARGLNDLAVRTRNRKLTPDDVQGGTFTISNYGVFGTTIGTPIINQPQVAILGVGAVTKRPVVINDAIAVRAMSFLTLSFDHRCIDGASGGLFLAEIVKLLEAERQ